MGQATPPPRSLLWEGQRNVLCFFFFFLGGESVSVRHRVRSAVVDHRPVRGLLLVL